MNTTQLIGNGAEKMAELKRLFLSLTDSDLLLLEYKQVEILKKLHKKAYKVYGDKHKRIAQA